MYAWIWRHLPFRQWPLKLATSVVAIAAIGALLWYVVFPWAEPLLPFDDVQVTDDSGVPGAPVESGAPGVGDEPTTGDEHDIPYDTEEPATPR
ncbi:hypothetical protein RB614_20875 [Phytohabitans sp. ZYX-F-186]|uniref:Uncharacterized protein n=1 Tax=Phytohabitans maris TaxID=3071409 RepID=A0ABU0ZIY0_9ACTN|nr:hypothetical protein [Phytohabitans sp. ZYX-F-186]MDQ7906970.1 hypothetical protein [Phytohabitans sp. ZYX-F-186]